MREIDLLACLPNSKEKRNWQERNIGCKLIAADRSEPFFYGERKHGYGGYEDDGRWNRVADAMISEYRLSKEDDHICQLGYEMGYLLNAFTDRGYLAGGVETSTYCRAKAKIRFSNVGPYWLTGYTNKQFGLVIAIGIVYTLPLHEVIKTLREIDRIGRKSFITLGSFDEPAHEPIMRQWSLLGTTILSKPDWLAVLQHCKYRGDYLFVTPRTLNLI